MTEAHPSKSSFNQYPEYNCSNQMYSLVIYRAKVLGHLPSCTQNNIVVSDDPLVWLLKKFKTNGSMVGLGICVPLRDVVPKPCISQGICSHALTREWMLLARQCSWGLELGPSPPVCVTHRLDCEHRCWQHLWTMLTMVIVEKGF